MKRRITLRSPASLPGSLGQERISEYFDQSKLDRKVRRVELLAVLEAIEQGKKQAKWYRRLWRWLTTTVKDETPLIDLKPPTPSPSEGKAS